VLGSRTLAETSVSVASRTHRAVLHGQSGIRLLSADALSSYTSVLQPIIRGKGNFSHPLSMSELSPVNTVTLHKLKNLDLVRAIIRLAFALLTSALNRLL